mgnify:CR=1 FL=1
MTTPPIVKCYVLMKISILYEINHDTSFWCFSLQLYWNTLISVTFAPRGSESFIPSCFHGNWHQALVVANHRQPPTLPLAYKLHAASWHCQQLIIFLFCVLFVSMCSENETFSRQILYTYTDSVRHLHCEQCLNQHRVILIYKCIYLPFLVQSKLHFHCSPLQRSGKRRKWLWL